MWFFLKGQKLHLIFCEKWQDDLASSSRQTIQHHSNQVYAPTTDDKEAEVEQLCKDLYLNIKLSWVHFKFIYCYMPIASQ